MRQKLSDTERRSAVMAAQASSLPISDAGDTFISRLLNIVVHLYRQEQYSDLVVKVAGEEVRAHKFVLAARSDVWSLTNLATTSVLDLSDAKPNIAQAMLRWVYTDVLELSGDDAFLT